MPASDWRIPELLAPAGGPESLRAAIANGADAVYLGVDVLNARRGAENFRIDTLAGACDAAHLKGVRVYLTVNVVVLPQELSSALELVDTAWASGVDAVILQDLGLIRAVRTSLPHVRIHASTQLNAHNTVTLGVLAQAGCSRVTLAREVSIEEVTSFVKADLVEVESFVHGALCMCYSGQCLMSSLIGRRSANRGLCAQPCRLPYELLREGSVVEQTVGAHLLSPKDLAGLAVLPELARAGVSALKVEGRMKSPEYVALVTGVYRAALDRISSAPDAYEVREGELAVLGESFSRGFSEAYLIGERGNDMMSYRRPNNRGVPIGRVTATSLGFATIALDASLDSADTIEFWTSAGRFAQSAGALSLDGGEHVAAPAGAKVTVTVERAVQTGDRVFRVRNAALETAARRTFAGEGLSATVPLDFVVEIVEGRPVRVEVEDETGRRGLAEGPVVERARTKVISAEEVAEQIGRLGGTPYAVGGWDLTLSAGVGVGFSALHQTRRVAIEDYERGLLSAWSARERTYPTLPEPAYTTPPCVTPQIVAVALGTEAAEACLAAGADVVHVPIDALGGPEALGRAIVPVLPRIAHDREIAFALRYAEPGRPVVAGNLGLLGEAVRAGAQVDAHWSLNVVNALAVDELAQIGAQRVWLSPELSGRQIAELVPRSKVPLGTAVWGRQEVMVTEHCVLMAEGDCDDRCGSCERRTGRTSLRDRKGYEFPVRTDITGRSHIYNSVVLDLTAALPEILSAGVSAVRLDLELEAPSAAAAVVSRFRRSLSAAAAGVEIDAAPSAGPTTSGHFYRGLV